MSEGVWKVHWPWHSRTNGRARPGGSGSIIRRNYGNREIISKLFSITSGFKIDFCRFWNRKCAKKAALLSLRHNPYLTRRFWWNPYLTRPIGSTKSGFLRKSLPYSRTFRKSWLDPLPRLRFSLPTDFRAAGIRILSTQRIGAAGVRIYLHKLYISKKFPAARA